MASSRKVDFFSLPPEIRNEIYSLLVICPGPIAVRSPRHQHEIRRGFWAPSNWVAWGAFYCHQLLGVNKQVNTEASMMFYAVNTFIFGNGPYGSKLTPNIHGLRHFLKRVPKNHIAGIQKVNILIHCRTVLNAPELSRKDVLGTMPDVKDLHSTIRALAKHFTSLKMIVFHYNLEGPSWDKNFEPYPLLTPEEGVSELAKMFRILVKKGLNFETFDHHNIKMRQAAEKVMKEIPGAAKIITLPPHSS